MTSALRQQLMDSIALEELRERAEADWQAFLARAEAYKATLDISDIVGGEE